MTKDDGRFQAAIAAIDAANEADPNPLVVRGQRRPKALGEAELATEWIRVLEPAASEALLLAARAHHLRRWQVPRSSYPEGRAGYLRWRRHLHERHASDVAAILSQVGYDEATIARVGDIVQKRDLGGDAEVQVFEDALCLVFLETQFAELAARLERDKMVDVLHKTLVKMSDTGRAAAARIPVSEAEAGLLRDATEPDRTGG